MNDKKDQYVTLFQAGMLILNILAVGLICGFIYATTNRILAHYDARTFLDSVVTIPVNPGENLLLCMGLMMVMVITFAAADLAAGSQPSDGLHTSGGRIRMCRTGRADGF